MSPPPVIRVLLVEDDEDDFVIMLEHLCRLATYAVEVDWVCTYPEAVADLAAGRHDLCIVDYRLGPDNGIDLIRELRSRGVAVPILMLTRYCDRFLEKRAREAGANAFLLKCDASPESLDHAMRSMLAAPTPARGPTAAG